MSIGIRFLVPLIGFVFFMIAPFNSVAAQVPSIEPGVSQELAKWRAAHYSDVRYKLNLTLEKMSPVLKGTIEIRVRVSSPTVKEDAMSVPPVVTGGSAASGMHRDREIGRVGST